MTKKKIHNKLERLINSLIITEHQKSFLQDKANNLFNELKLISRDQIPYWSSLYLSKSTYLFTLDRFWLRGSFNKGLFIKNRFDIDIYFVYSRHNTYPKKQSNLIGSILFELLYSHLKVYQFYHKEDLKLLKEPPYGYAIPIRMDYQGISILFNCVPAIKLPNGNLILPNGIGGTKKLNLKLEEKALMRLYNKQNGKIRKLIILIKYWNFNWGKPIKRDLIEQLIEFIFDTTKVHSWERAIETFFQQSINILEKQKFIPYRADNQYSLLNEGSNDELENYLKLFREALIYTQKGKWEKIFSDL